MSISDKGKLVRALVLWAAVGILTALFAAGYESLSHGVVSLYMVGAFLIPLLLGCGAVGALLALRARPAGDMSMALWDTAVGLLTVGSLIRGALEIYGTTNRLTIVYPIAGAMLISLAAACYLMRK